MHQGGPQALTDRHGEPARAGGVRPPNQPPRAMRLLLLLVLPLVLLACDAPEPPEPSDGEPAEAVAVEPVVIEGEATYRERIALPEGAVLSVRLVDLETLEAVAETAETARGQVPIAFRLEAPGERIADEASYALVAELHSDTPMAWGTPEPVPVSLLAGRAEPVALELRALEEAQSETADGTGEVEERLRSEGVSFRALGQEPGWFANVYGDPAAPDRLVIAYDYGQVEHESSNITRETLADGYRLTGQAAGGPISLRVTNTPCQDPMSGQRFPATVSAEVGSERLAGCGRPL